jgi:hypothetical protein
MTTVGVGVRHDEVVHQMEMTVFPYESTSGLPTWPHRSGQHEAEIIIKCSYEPAEVALCEPIAGSPRMVATSSASNAKGLTADGYRPSGVDQVLKMPIGLSWQENPLNIVLVSTHHRGQPTTKGLQVDSAPGAFALLKCSLGVGQRPRIRQQNGLAFVRNSAFPEGRDYLPAQLTLIIRVLSDHKGCCAVRQCGTQ